MTADCLLGPNRRLAFAGPGALSLEERAAPSLGRGDDVILEVLACGLCGTDAHALKDPMAAELSPGRVLGHEIVGRVAAVREGVEAKIGSLQVVIPNLRCGHCRPCQDGRVNLCDHFVHVGFGRDGGLARYITLPSRTLVGVPDGLHPDVAVLAEPLGCVLNAVHTAGWGPGTTALICGAGPIGLLLVAMAALHGVEQILVTEPSAERRQLAERLGAQLVVDPSAGDAENNVRVATEGRGPDVVVDTVGHQLPFAVNVVAKGGLILIFGLDDRPVTLNSPTLIVSREIRVSGAFIRATQFQKPCAFLHRTQSCSGRW